MTSAHHLAIDGVGARHGGAATVLVDLVAAALEHPAIGRVTVFASPADERRFVLPSDPRLDVVEPRGTGGRIARIAWLEAGLALAARRAGASLLVALGGGGLGRGVPTAVLVQRPQPFSDQFARSASPLEKLRIAALVRTLARAAKHADLVVVQTPTMRGLVEARFQLPAKRLLLCEPAPPHLPRGTPSPMLVRMRSARGPRLLYVGSATAYKDLPTLRKTAWLVRTVHPEACLFATIRATPSDVEDGCVVPLGYLPADVLREAYELADVVLLASREETVGFPLLEAMDVGTPVIVADLPYAHDVCDDAALYFSPGDARGAADAVSQLLADDALRTRLAARGAALVQARREARPSTRLLEALISSAPRAA